VIILFRDVILFRFSLDASPIWMAYYYPD